MPETRLASLARRWLALVAALALLVLSGRGGLAAPPSARPATLRAWAGARPPVETALAVIRLLALGAGGYLVIVVSVAVLGQLLGHRPTLHLAARLTPAGLRPLLALAATTATVAVGLTVVASGAEGAARPAPPPILRWVAGSTVAGNRVAGSSIPTPGNGHPPAVPRLRPGVMPPTDAGPAVPAAAPAAKAAGSSRASPTPRRRPNGEATHYVVRHGDSFWTIATHRLEMATAGAPPDQGEIARYWHLLVQANLAMLPVPGHPDLLFPGDRIRLPAHSLGTR